MKQVQTRLSDETWEWIQGIAKKMTDEGHNIGYPDRTHVGAVLEYIRSNEVSEKDVELMHRMMQIAGIQIEELRSMLGKFVNLKEYKWNEQNQR